MLQISDHLSFDMNDTFYFQLNEYVEIPIQYNSFTEDFDIDDPSFVVRMFIRDYISWTWVRNRMKELLFGKTVKLKYKLCIGDSLDLSIKNMTIDDKEDYENFYTRFKNDNLILLEDY